MEKISNVSVPREYFVKSAKNDYRDPSQAFLREVLQNSRDSGAKNIEMYLKESSSSQVIFTCTDDGCGMSLEILTEKLMCLGGTTKTAASGETGGYGIAKILLFLAQVNYQIETRDLILTGEGGCYTVKKSDTFVKGTKITVTLNDQIIPSSSRNLEEIFIRELRRSDLPGITVSINNTVVECSNKKGRLVEEILPRVKIYKKNREGKSTTNYGAVRVNGLHMFGIYLNESPYDLIVEITGHPIDILTANRDGLRSEYSEAVTLCTQRILANKNYAQKANIHRYRGEASRVSQAARLKKCLEESMAGRTDLSESEMTTVLGVVQEQFTQFGLSMDTPSIKDILFSKGGDSFNFKGDEGIDQALSTIANKHHYYVETKGKFRGVPAAWKKENLSSKKEELLELWAKVISMVMADCGYEGRKFDAGFLLDDGSEGDRALAKFVKYTVNGEAEQKSVFLLNPLVYGSENSLPLSKSRRKELILWLKSLAVHEFIHYQGYQYHNERFIEAEGAATQKTLTNIKAYLAL